MPVKNTDLVPIDKSALENYDSGCDWTCRVVLVPEFENDGLEIHDRSVDK